MRKEAVLFCKKEPKNFIYAGAWAVAATAPQAQSHRSFFASFFSKKEVFK
jgi:hypothetical protein